MMERYDVAVVLGAALTADGEASPALERRVGCGVRLLREGRVAHLLMSGGAVGHPTPEARVMRALALGEGAPEERLVVEDKAMRTLENAFFSAPMIRERGWRSVVVVTDIFHLPRALFAFRAAGIRARGCAVPGEWRARPPAALASHLAREALAFIWYLWLVARGRPLVGATVPRWLDRSRRPPV